MKNQIVKLWLLLFLTVSVASCSKTPQESIRPAETESYPPGANRPQEVATGKCLDRNNPRTEDVSAQVASEDGNIVYIDSEGTKTTLTTSGLDCSPVLAPDGGTVAFIRSEPYPFGDGHGRHTDCAIWMIDIDGQNARRVVAGQDAEDDKEIVCNLRWLVFSPDGRRLFFHCWTWVTAYALHVYDLDTGERSFVTIGDLIRVIPDRGKYANHLLVEKRKYFLGGGTYTFIWLLTPEGESVRPVSRDRKDDPPFDNFWEMYVEKSLPFSGHSGNTRSTESKSIPDPGAERLKRAHVQWEAGNQEAAVFLYRAAAQTGTPEGLYYLATRTDQPSQNRIRLLTQAARKGHADALRSALDCMFFHSNSLRDTDASKAWALYQEVIHEHPELARLSEIQARALQCAAEAPDFNPDEFLQSFGIPETVEDEVQADYYIWELAEEASRGGRFGRPDPGLVLNLIIRGNDPFSPAKPEAILDFYDAWRKGEVVEFNISDYATSGRTVGYLANRETSKIQSQWRNERAELARKHDEYVARLMDKVWDLASDFHNAKAEKEEGNSMGTTWDSFRCRQSAHLQLSAFMRLLHRIDNGFQPANGATAEDAENELNRVFRLVMDETASDPQNRWDSLGITREGLRAVQQQWILFRDAAIELFSALNHNVPPKDWSAWLTEHRTAQLQRIVDLDPGARICFQAIREGSGLPCCHKGECEW